MTPKQSKTRVKKAGRAPAEARVMRPETIRTLIVSCSRKTAERVAGILQNGGCDIEWRRVNSANGLASALTRSDWDIVLSDFGISRLSVRDIVNETRAHQPRVPVIVFSENLPADSILEIFRAGAADYVPANEHDDLRAAVQRTLRKASAEMAAEEAEFSLNEYRAYLEDLIRARAVELQEIDRKLQAEVDYHRATVQALRATEESFRAITEALPDIISKFDRDLRHVYVNPAVESVTGMAVGDYLGKTNRELGMPEDLCKLWEGLIREVFATGEIRESYFEFPSPDGVHSFHIRMLPESSPSGEVASVVSIARDVTDAKRAESALARSEYAFRSLAENAACVILRVSPGLEIIYSNPVSECLTDLRPSEIKGKCLSDLGLPASAVRSLKSMFGKAFKSGEWQNRKVRFKIGQEVMIFDVTVVPEMSETGHVETALAMIHDISKAEREGDILKRDRADSREMLRERTAELYQTRVELAEAERLSDIGTLAARVAHELRNPLAVIQTAAYNIRKKRENRGLDKHVDSIEKKIAQSNQIISNLLNYSRLKQPRRRKTVLLELIEECLAGAGDRFSSTGVEVALQIDSIRGRQFLIDPDQMGEVIANILNNAYQAFDGRSGRISISTRRDDANRNLVIAISDNGPGMSTEVAERAVDPFFTTRSKGTGLGLTICRDIVRLHGGIMAIESRVGKGTTVKINLPLE